MATENPTPPSGEPNHSGDGASVDLSGVKKKRGRPVGSTNKASASSKADEGLSPADIELNAKFLSETAVLLFETADEMIQRHCANKINSVMPEKLPDFEALQKEVGLNEKDKKLVGVSVLRLAQKYEILGRFGPEILLMVTTAQYGIRQARLVSFVNDAVKEMKELKKNQAGSAPVNGSPKAPDAQAELVRN